MLWKAPVRRGRPRSLARVLHDALQLLDVAVNPGKDREWTGLGPLLLACVLFSGLAYAYRFTIDDAFISFRYAAHLAEGQGLRFNLGETAPVAGYSNLLWVLVLAGARRLGFELEPAAQSLGWFSGVLLIAAVWRSCRAGGRWSLAELSLPLVFLATLPMVFFWATGGLETLAFAWVLLALHRALRANSAAPAALAAAALVTLRIDGAVWLTIAIAGTLLAARTGGHALPRRALGVALVSAGIAIALVALWTHSYYGDWLPRTARVKGGWSPERTVRGGFYVASWLLSQAGLALLLAWAFAARRRLSPEGVGAGLCVVAGASYVAIVGGDWMPMWRYLVPVAPFAALLLRDLVRSEGRRAWPRIGTGVLVILLSLPSAFGVEWLPRKWVEALAFREGFWSTLTEYDSWRLDVEAAEDSSALEALRLHTRPGESLITGAIGRIGYATDLVIYDPFGLVTPTGVPLQRLRSGSPGHDVRASPDLLFRFRPTYYSAFVLDPELELDSVRAELERSSELPRLDYETHGLEGGGTLVLARFPDWSWLDTFEPLRAVVAGLDPAEPAAREEFERRLQAARDPGSGGSSPEDPAAACAELWREGLIAYGSRNTGRIPLELPGYAVYASLVQPQTPAVQLADGGFVFWVDLTDEPTGEWQVVVPGNSTRRVHRPSLCVAFVRTSS